MDSLITAAARALAAGDLLGALNRVSLRNDPPALALRGIAMAQLGDFERAKQLLRKAASRFGPKEAVARARCVVAEAEIALTQRDLGWTAKRLDAAQATLDKHGDRLNAAHARHLQIRLLLLIGRLDAAEHALAGLDASSFPPASRAAHELVVAGIALRRLRTKAARDALTRAARAARISGLPALVAEVENAAQALDAPAARLIAEGEERALRLDEVETVLASDALVVDACRRVVRCGKMVVSLATRPVLFALARCLGEAWPRDVPRDVLLTRAFGARHVDESHRARLRVEIGRLRAALKPLAAIDATERGFAMRARPHPEKPHATSAHPSRLASLAPQGEVPREASRRMKARKVAVLAPPVDTEHAEVLAFLADGEAWSSSALALALGASPRTVQRALEALAKKGQVQSLGRGRAQRWLTPPPAFPTVLLLPGPLPGD